MIDDIEHVKFIKTDKYTGQIEYKTVEITYLHPWRTLESEIQKYCINGWERDIFNYYKRR